jgi:hypothetical protein
MQEQFAADRKGLRECRKCSSDCERLLSRRAAAP